MTAGPLDAQDWEAMLRRSLARAVQVTYTKARSTPVEAVFHGRSLRLKLHRFFADAPEPVREALASWLVGGRRARRASKALDQWIDEQRAALPPKRERRFRVTTHGHHHDLSAPAAELFATEFAGDFRGRPLPQVTWGRRTRSRARYSLTLGSYDPHTQTVRIHPALDDERVPEWFVRYVLFHEILHAALPSESSCRGGGFHGPAFRERERAYPDYERAKRWERRHLGRLLRSARRGSPHPPAPDSPVTRPIQAWLFRH